MLKSVLKNWAEDQWNDFLIHYPLLAACLILV